MPNYCVNSNSQPLTGDHEVHDEASTLGCLPEPKHRVALGWHSNCASAVAAASRIYTDVNGCAYCAEACHTT